MLIKKILCLALLFGSVLSWAYPFQLSLKDETFQAQTLSPLQASTNKVGDRFSLLVLSPSRWKDSMIEGEITEAKASGKSETHSNLAFAFHKMALPDGSILSIQAALLKVANSKGEVGLDEDGNVIGQSSRSSEEGAPEVQSKSKNVFSRFGKKVAKSAKGVAQKIAGGMTIAFTSENKDIRFASGSLFTLSVSTTQVGSSSPTSAK